MTFIIEFNEEREREYTLVKFLHHVHEFIPGQFGKPYCIPWTASANHEAIGRKWSYISKRVVVGVTFGVITSNP